MTDPTPTRARRAERAVALPMALILAFVAAVIIVAVLMSAHSAADRSRSNTNDALGRTPADQGAASYLRALNARVVGEHNDFHFPFADPRIAELLPEGTQILQNSSLPGELGQVDTSAATGVPADSRATYRRETSSGTWTYWQLFSLVRPDWRAPGGTPTSGAKVIAYFRGWVGNEQSSGRPETVVVRVELRPQRFADYQFIVDGQISFGPGASIQGPVHSNGFTDRLWGSVDPSDPSIKGSSISCSPDARFSTSTGGIDIARGGCTAAMQRSGIKETINIRALAAEAEFHWKLCGGGSSFSSPEGRFHVRCIVPAAGSPATIDLGSAATAPATLVLVDGSARVSGSVPANRRVTVLAYDVEQGPASTTGANVHVLGNVGHGSGAMLGLFAGDDVFVETSVASPCAVTSIDGAVIAATGTLSLPATWRVPLAPTGAAPVCGGQFTSTGSIAGHYTPFLALQDNSGVTMVGFQKRAYVYDRNLRYTPPPAMPLATQWQKYGYDEANKSCFNATSYALASMECA